MQLLKKISLRFRSLFLRKSVDSELDSELRFHIEKQIAANAASGMTPVEARRQAMIEFGGVQELKEECRDMRKINWLQDFAQDVRFGLRILRKSPGFTAVAVLTLALGIGANTAIFSIVYGVLLRPFSYSNPGQLVLLFDVPSKQPNALSAISYRDFTMYRQRNHVFRELAGNGFHDLTLTGAGEPTIVNIAAVTPEIFPLLGVKSLAGRIMLPEDGKQGAAPVAVLSESLWRNRFSSDPGIIGRSIILDMRPFTVIGILPADFRYPDGGPHQDVWIPIAQDPLFGPRLLRPGVPALGGVGRLMPGVTLAQAQAEMTALSAQLAKEFPAQDSGLTMRVVPYRQFVVGDVKSALLILLGAVGVVLLIACVNIANLLLSRAASRGREIAVRIALGAGRARIVRQLLTESALLGLLGGIAGVLLAVWGVRALQSFMPPEVTRIQSIQIGGFVLLFALLLSLAAALAFGLAPAMLATQPRLQSNIKEGTAGAGQRGSRRVRNFLAIAEISLAMTLLVAGGLLIRSFALVNSVNPGFDANNVIRAEVSLPQFQYSSPQQWSSFADELLARLHVLPGLQDSALAAPLPMDRQGEASFPFTIVGNPPLPAGKSNAADYATVSPDYFRVMRIPLLQGRLFSPQDSPSTPNVAIISKTLANRFFPQQNPIGRQMRFGFPPNDNVPREIVGVVGDVRDESLSREPGPMMYVPFAQAPLYGGEVVVRSSLIASNIAAGIRQAVGSIDKNLPVTDVESFPDALGASVAQERFRTLLLGLFGALALVLSAVGIFGVISYSASQRTHEIGLRMALGAQPRDIVRMVLREGFFLAFTGIACGFVAALALTRFLRGLLFQIKPTDPVTFVGAAILLALVALLACYIPARRAMRVDPIIALRYE